VTKRADVLSLHRPPATPSAAYASPSDKRLLLEHGRNAVHAAWPQHRCLESTGAGHVSRSRADAAGQPQPQNKRARDDVWTSVIEAAGQPRNFAMRRPRERRRSLTPIDAQRRVAAASSFKALAARFFALDPGHQSRLPGPWPSSAPKALAQEGGDRRVDQTGHFESARFAPKGIVASFFEQSARAPHHQ